MAKAQFKKSGAVITTYLDKLDSAVTPYEIRVKDYPAEYKAIYMQALLKLSPEYTEAGLLKDLDNLLNYYKKE